MNNLVNIIIERAEYRGYAEGYSTTGFCTSINMS